MSRRSAKFIALDGEGITRTDGSNIQDYVMLCASTGEYITNENGLGSLECFTFLLSLKEKYPGYTFVGFGFNYDVNMMLKDFSREQLEELWKHNETDVILDDLYRVNWIPNKKFYIRGSVSITIFDVFGFFQSKFTTALKDWKIPDSTNEKVLQEIESGKANRGEFVRDDMQEMLSYCLAECRMLVDLMEALQDALQDAELYLTQWMGAGSVAAAMLKKYNIKEHHCHDESLPKPIQEAVMSAYFGGRFQMLQQGHFAECYNYDLISAYPSEARQLPTLNGEWEKASKYDPDAEYALWLCEWDLPPTRPVMPFPYREKEGTIYYPFRGMGWYWSQEVRAALRMHPEIKVKRGYVFHPAYTKKPFWFIDMVAAKRKAAKEAGKASQKAYKLGLNSLYGKLAQGIGYRGMPPPFRSFVWAGMITSNTRARLLEYSLGREDTVIAYATDGIFFDSNADLPTGNELGELELGKLDDFYMLASGIYFTGSDSEVAKKLRTRGHNPRELDVDILKEAWYREGPEFVYWYKAKRFIGLGSALMMKDFSLWRQWVVADRKLSLDNQRGWLLDSIGDILIPGVDIDRYGESIRWYHFSVDTKLGKPYTPKGKKSRQTEEEKQAIMQLTLEFEQPFVSNVEQELAF